MKKSQSSTLLLASLLSVFNFEALALTINEINVDTLNSYEQTAITAAINDIDNLFTNTSTLTIDFSGTMPTGYTSDLGASGTPSYQAYTYGSVAAAVDQNYGSAILSKTANPTGGSLTDYVYLSPANVAVLENRSPRQSVGEIYINSADFNNQANSTNLVGIVEHEITEVLGRTSGLTTNSTTSELNLLDLFRYSTAGKISTSATDTTAYFSLDGGKTDLMNYNTNISAGDLGDWATSGTTANNLDALNYSAAIGGPVLGLTPVDIQEMQALGYTTAISVVPLPTTIWSFLLGVLGILFIKKRNP